MLVLDIGGTFVKFGLTDPEGRLISESVDQVPSDANGSYEHFLSVLREVINRAGQIQKIESACVSIAGPFDFENGVSRMKHKFPALYERSIRTPFEEQGIPVTFLHDSTAFMLGAAEGMPGNACGVMLGTGLGFAFMQDGRVCVDENQTPAFTLWNMPWKDGIAEDYVSQRAILAAYGDAVSVKAIAEAARAGETKARETFRAIGRNLSEILNAVIPALGCDSLILGGQIARSADLFELSLPVPWQVVQHPEAVALRGAGRCAGAGKAACTLSRPKILLNGG